MHHEPFVLCELTLWRIYNSYHKIYRCHDYVIVSRLILAVIIVDAKHLKNPEHWISFPHGNETIAIFDHELKREVMRAILSISNHELRTFALMKHFLWIIEFLYLSSNTLIPIETWFAIWKYLKQWVSLAGKLAFLGDMI